MNFKYIALLAIAIVPIGAAAPTPTAAPVVCAPSVPFADGLRVINVVRVVKGENGESDFVATKLSATTHRYFDLPGLFAALNLGAASKVQIVSGPPHVTLPFHASLGYEIFITLQGSSTVVLPDGRERELGPGTMVIMEDMGSKTGHAGRTGPCGYVALQAQLTTPIS